MKENLFKWKHFQPEIILLCVRWYLKYALSYRDLEEIMSERGFHINHSTIYRWVIQYAPLLNKRIRKHLRKTNDSWRMDETYIKLRGKWMYLYRAVDTKGDTVDFWLSENRDKIAAKRFFRKSFMSPHNDKPRVICTDKYAATTLTIQSEIEKGTLKGSVAKSR